MHAQTTALFPSTVALVVALALSVIGVLWLRRITSGEDGPGSFIATATRRFRPSVGLMVGVALLGMVALYIGVHGPSVAVADAGGSAADLSAALVFMGGLLEVFAIVLVDRRLQS